MASIFAKLPLINLWSWANGDEFTIEDENTDSTPELAKSDVETDREYTQRFGQKENSKKRSFKEVNKVKEEELNKSETTVKETEKSKDEKEL